MKTPWLRGDGFARTEIMLAAGGTSSQQQTLVSWLQHRATRQGGARCLNPETAALGLVCIRPSPRDYAGLHRARL